MYWVAYITILATAVPFIIGEYAARQYFRVRNRFTRWGAHIIFERSRGFEPKDREFLRQFLYVVPRNVPIFEHCDHCREWFIREKGVAVLGKDEDEYNYYCSDKCEEGAVRVDALRPDS